MMSQFSNTNLKFLNLLIGLCKRVKGLPTDLLNLGYAVQWIELDFTNSAGKEVKPEIILTSRSHRNTLIFEFKSGTSIDKNQLLKYSQITTEDLIQRAAIDRNNLRSFDVVYLCLEENKQNIVQTIQDGGYSFPVLSVKEDAVLLAHNRFSTTELNSIFSPGLKVNFSQAPTNFVPLDTESKSWEIAEILIPKIIHYMYRNKTPFQLTFLCKDLIECWDILGPSTQKYFRDKVNRIMELACQGQFKKFLVRARPLKKLRHESVWEIKYNPLSLPAQKSRVEFQKIRELQKEFLISLKTGAAQESLDLGQ